MEKAAVDLYLAVSHEGDEMRKRVESMQKYIEVLEENLEYSTISCQKIGDRKRKFEG